VSLVAILDGIAIIQEGFVQLKLAIQVLVSVITAYIKLIELIKLKLLLERIGSFRGELLLLMI
jgi:hypothetical protein